MTPIPVVLPPCTVRVYTGHCALMHDMPWHPACTCACVQVQLDTAGPEGDLVQACLVRSFIEVDKEFAAISEGIYVGTTAVVALIGNTRIWVAHCGKAVTARAVLRVRQIARCTRCDRDR